MSLVSGIEGPHECIPLAGNYLLDLSWDYYANSTEASVWKMAGEKRLRNRKGVKNQEVAGMLNGEATWNSVGWETGMFE